MRTGDGPTTVPVTSAGPPTRRLDPPAGPQPAGHEPVAPQPLEPVSSTEPAAAQAAPPERFRLGYRPELDGVRGMAVVLVLGFHLVAVHWPNGPSWIPPGGFLGVDVFFVLSGFLITALLLAENERRGRVGYGPFLVRRARRLVPALVGLLAAMYLVALTGRMWDTGTVGYTAVRVLSFTNNWPWFQGRMVAGHLWSIAVEVHFYVLWGLLVTLAVRTRRPHRTLALVAAAGIVAVVLWRIVAVHTGQAEFGLYAQTPARLDAPLMGALAGVIVSAGWLPALRGRSAALVGVGGMVVLGVAVTAVEGTDRVLYLGLSTVLAASMAFIVVSAVREPGGVVGHLLAGRWLVFLGTISYSIYVWHLPVLEVVDKNTSGWHPLARMAVSLPIVIAAAWASYRLIERRFMRRRPGATTG